MPSLQVTKNGKLLCAVGSDDVSMFTASVWAEIWGPERSNLTVTGSSKSSEDQPGSFLVWYLAHELGPNDRLSFAFAVDSASSPPDQTPIEEPKPEERVPDFFAPISEVELQKLESRGVQNGNCKWRVSLSGKGSFLVAPDPERQHCSLHLMWNDHRPERLRASLSKSSLREISARADGEKLFVEHMPIGAQLELQIET
jgi:hypothetical protein